MSLPSFSLNFAARRVRLIAAIVAGLALAWGGSAYWAGLQAEKTLDEQYRLLTGLPFFVVKSHSYDRGWFSSTETTELTFNKKLFAPYMGMLPEQAAGKVGLGSDVHIVLDAAPQYVLPARVSYVASVAQFTPKSVETQDERQKMVFRVKARLDPALLKKYAEHVKTGLPGMAYVRLDPAAAWPAKLEVQLP